VLIIIVAALTSWWALLGLAGLMLIIPALRAVITGALGPALIPVLKSTGLAELATALGLAVGLVISGF